MHDHILVYARLAKANKDDSYGWKRQLYDQPKTNAVLEIKDRDIEFRTV